VKRELPVGRSNTEGWTTATTLLDDPFLRKMIAASWGTK